MIGRHRKVELFQNLVGDARKPQARAVFRGVDRSHAVSGQGGDLIGQDDAAAAGENTDVTGALRRQAVHQVLEKFHVPALVGGDRHGPGVFLNRRSHDFPGRAVVAQMDHLRAAGLEQAPEDVDGGVVAVEQCCGRDDADGVPMSVWADLGCHGCSGYGSLRESQRCHAGFYIDQYQQYTS